MLEVDHKCTFRLSNAPGHRMLPLRVFLVQLPTAASPHAGSKLPEAICLIFKSLEQYHLPSVKRALSER